MENINGKTIVLGVIGSDIHITGMKILEFALREAGFKVISLGIKVTQEEFIEAAIETNADVIAVSSLYGLAELDCRGLRDKAKEAGLGDILIYIGGNLAVGKQNWNDVEKVFKDMGFDRVYPPNASLDQVVADLKTDLNILS